MGLGLQPRIARATYDLNCLAVRLLPQRQHLIVLTYHRVGSAADLWPETTGLAECTLEQFEAQMAWVRQYCRPVTLAEVQSIVAGAPCPSRAVLVTFDDGYREDLRRAAPCLRRTGIRPVVFLPTGYIGTRRRFWWDRVGVCIQTTVRPRLVARLGPGLDLPLDTAAARGAAVDAVIELLKPLPADEQEGWLATLERELGVASTAEAERPIVLDWDEVRELLGVYDFGAHTVSHPMLSRIDAATARDELARSKAAIEEQLGVGCPAFAIPYGGAEDYTAEALPIAAEVGFSLVFSFESALRPPVREGSCALVDRVAIDSGAGLPGVAAKITWPRVFVPDWTRRAARQIARLLEA